MDEVPADRYAGTVGTILLDAVVDAYREVLELALHDGVFPRPIAVLEDLQERGSHNPSGYFPTDPDWGYFQIRLALEFIGHLIEQQLPGSREGIGARLHHAIQSLIDEETERMREEDEVGRQRAIPRALTDEEMDTEVIHVESHEDNVVICLNHKENRWRILSLEAGRIVEHFLAADR